ncbi:hypothetical protein FOZ61_009479 [Perkinsus olseni]|uniref:RRM domain-containing protein n=1 Tax=Perkinsus olseni TaxID=32597 RepID=A0A7J6L1L4_PEROL|nr:hypothetical protein FOZ61_009479 [Perkinsus olseni]
MVRVTLGWAAAGEGGGSDVQPVGTTGGPRRRAELPETIRTFLDRPDEVARDDVRTIINNFEKTQLVELLAHASTISKEVRDALRAVVGSNATFRRLLVRNISFQSSSDTVKNALGKFGMIEEGTVVYDRHTGRSKGFAFVTFERVESACEAVSCSNQGKIYLDGRQLILKFAADKIDHDQQMGVIQALPSGGEREKSAEISAASSVGGGSGQAAIVSSSDTGNRGAAATYSNQSMRKLFVYNLAPYTTSETLREVFGKYGPMDECIVVYDSAGKSKRYAFVTYSNVEDAWACLEEPHKTVDGRMTFTHLASEGSSSAGGASGSGEYGNRRSRSNFAGPSRPPRGHSPAGRSGGIPRSGSMGGGDRTPGGKGHRKGYSTGPPPQAASQAGSMRVSQQQQHESPMGDITTRSDQSPLSQSRHQMESGGPKQQQQQQMQVIDELEDDTKERNIVTKPLHAGTMLYGKKCTRLDYEGNGVVPVYSRVCKYLYTPKHPRVLPGDTVDLSVERKVDFWDRRTSPRYALTVQSGVKPSGLRVPEIPCKHFDEGCGGCKILPLKYDEQVRRKIRFLSQLCPTQPLEFHKSTSELGFRTLSVDVVFNEPKTTPGGVSPDVQFGAVKFDTEQNMAIADCALLTPLAAKVRRIAMDKIEEAVRDTRGPRQNRITVYSARNGSGILRRLWVRVNDTDTQAIVGLEVSPGVSGECMRKLVGLARSMKDICGDLLVGVVKIERFQYSGVEDDDLPSRPHTGDVPLVGDGSLAIAIEGFDNPYMLQTSGHFPTHAGLTSVLLNTIVGMCETDAHIVDLYASRTHGLFTGLLVAIGNPNVTCVVDSSMIEGNHTIASSFDDEDANFIEVSSLATEEGLKEMSIEGPVHTVLLTPLPEEGVSPWVRKWVDEVEPERIVYYNASFKSATADVKDLAKSTRDGLSYEVVELKGFDTKPHTMECSVVLVMQRKFDPLEARRAEERRQRSNDSSRDYLGIDEDKEEIDLSSEDDDEFDVEKLVAQYSGGVQAGKDGIFDHHTDRDHPREDGPEEWTLPPKDAEQAPPVNDDHHQPSPGFDVDTPLPSGEEESEGSVEKRWQRGDQDRKEGGTRVHRRNKNKRWSH